MRYETFDVVPLSRRAEWSEGQPISELMSLAIANPDLISLAAGFVDERTLPVAAASRAVEEIFNDPQLARAALQYGTTPGFVPLREAILARHVSADHVAPSESGLTVEQVVCTAGSNQLLHLISECILDPGDIMLCGSPTYFVYLGTLANLGARAIGVKTDAEGMDPDSLEATLQQIDATGELHRVKGIYVASYSDNPCGITLPIDRRRRIVDIAKRWSQSARLVVIEDVAYRELLYSGDDIPSMRSLDAEGDTVVLAGTFSKPFSPGIRVGWGLLPEYLVEPVGNQKGNIDFGSPNFNQLLMAKVLELNLFDPHVQTLCAQYRKKMGAVLDAMDTHLSALPGVSWVKPTGGLYVWLRLPAEIDAGPGGKLLDEAMREGMFYVPGEYCYPLEGEPACKNTLRLSFGVQSTERIRIGIESLARAIRKFVVQ